MERKDRIPQKENVNTDNHVNRANVSKNVKDFTAGYKIPRH